jgi:hypothetical protein
VVEGGCCLPSSQDKPALRIGQVTRETNEYALRRFAAVQAGEEERLGEEWRRLDAILMEQKAFHGRSLA